MYKLNNFLIPDLSNIITNFFINKRDEWIDRFSYQIFDFNSKNLLYIELKKVLPNLKNFWEFKNYYLHNSIIINNQEHPVFITTFFAKLENKKCVYIKYSHSYTEIFDLKIEEI